ncbi:hypothetical protein ACFVHB_34755 [Kitasatospora sp. NPDC127111]|uniref:hypothetical protein n=1 Tax=Kitasatospora sp. NPDC127111 TaxID=3345363 RepID=UPI00362FD6F5
MTPQDHTGERPGAEGPAAGYLVRLAARLRGAGMPEREVTSTVADLEGYLAESGSPDPYEEFGPPEDFAARLTHTPGPEEPGPGVETWKWAADIHSDVPHLNRFGVQGWELEGLDRLGRFVCRRPAEGAMGWEYRREAAPTGAGRDALAEELAPEGWEPCGGFLSFRYFKRPLAASTGPAARIADPVAPPDRHLFLDRSSQAKLTRMVVAAVLAGTASALAVHYAGERLALPILLGSLVVLAVGLGTGWRRVKRELLAARGTGSAEDA